MKPVHRLNDLGNHCPIPRIMKNGSPNVKANNLPIARIQDFYKGCPCPVPAYITTGSPTVKVNGKQIARLNDPINCGGKAITASPNVKV